MMDPIPVFLMLFALIILGGTLWIAQWLYKSVQQNGWVKQTFADLIFGLLGMGIALGLMFITGLAGWRWLETYY